MNSIDKPLGCVANAEPSISESGSAVPKARILVVDDHLSGREYVKTVLGYAGHEVLEAADGQEGLEIASRHRPDLIISDILMPKLNGLEMVRQIRGQPEIAGTRIIIWSATFRQSEAQTMAAALDVAQFLKKPVEPQTLLAAVKEILAAPPPSSVPLAVLAKLEEAHHRLLNEKLYKKTLELEQEIKERQQVEIALRESQHSFAGLIESAMDAIISIDAEQRIVLFNAAAEALFRCPAAEAIGSPVERFIPEHFRTLHGDQVRQFATAGIAARTVGQTMAFWGMRADGMEFPIEASISKVHVGGQWRLTVILRDITERRRAEEQLKASESRFRLLCDFAPVLIWMSGLDKGCTWFNRPWLDFTGRTMEQEVGAGWTEGVHPDDFERCLHIYETAFDRREPFAMEYRLRHHDGEYRWIFDQGVPRFEGRMGFTGYIGSCFDITERKTAAAQVQRLNADLEQRVRERTAELERSNDALLHSNSELQHFAHAAAHDLQTPLRSIAGFTQLLQREVQGQVNERADEWLSLVIDNTKRLHTLIQECLAYTRLDAQGLPFQAVDLRDVADQVVTSLAVLVQETGAEICCDPLPTLSVDRTQIAQVLQNLIENAIKYNQSKPPKLAIGCEFQEDEWLFSVADNGIGIDSRHHERIFEIFRRLHTYSQVPGTGIGLALCRRIVERHGGHIWVESRPGEGSTFYFTLPVRSAID